MIIDVKKFCRPRLDRFSGIVDIGCYEYIPTGLLLYSR